MKAILKQSLLMIFWMTFLTGILYPLVLTQIAQLLMNETANGSLLHSKTDHRLLGSRLIAQKFVQDKYFWPRPSAIDYNPLPSGGSNLGPTSEALRISILQKSKQLGIDKTDATLEAIPLNLLFTSGSGLDPDIMINSALVQVDRVAKARGLESPAEKKKIIELIYESKVKKSLNLFGRDCVNVLILNDA